MRFWRDIYYEVNAPVVFQGYSKAFCNDAQHGSGLVCRSAKRNAATRVAVVIVFSGQRPSEELEVLVGALAAIRRWFWPEADLHVFLTLGPKSTNAHLTTLERLVGMDSTVSVLSRPSLEVLRCVLEGFHGFFVADSADLGCFAGSTLDGCESPLPAPSLGIVKFSLGQCSMSSSADLEAAVAALDDALSNGKAAVLSRGGNRRSCAQPPAVGSDTRALRKGIQNAPIGGRPLLVAEAVSSDKQVTLRLRPPLH
jgi:hypothetical protein